MEMIQVFAVYEMMRVLLYFSNWYLAQPDRILTGFSCELCKKYLTEHIRVTVSANPN